MDLDKYTDEELYQSLIAEAAKSIGEIRCAQNDIDKINSRLRFILAVIHSLKDRKVKDL